MTQVVTLVVSRDPAGSAVVKAVFSTHKEAARYRWILVGKAQEAGSRDTYALETRVLFTDATPLIDNLLGVEE